MGAQDDAEEAGFLGRGVVSETQLNEDFEVDLLKQRLRKLQARQSSQNLRQEILKRPSTAAGVGGRKGSDLAAARRFGSFASPQQVEAPERPATALSFSQTFADRPDPLSRHLPKSAQLQRVANRSGCLSFSRPGSAASIGPVTLGEEAQDQLIVGSPSRSLRRQNQPDTQEDDQDVSAVLDTRPFSAQFSTTSHTPLYFHSRPSSSVGRPGSALSNGDTLRNSLEGTSTTAIHAPFESVEWNQDEEGEGTVRPWHTRVPQEMGTNFSPEGDMGELGTFADIAEEYTNNYRPESAVAREKKLREAIARARAPVPAQEQSDTTGESTTDDGTDERGYWVSDQLKWLDIPVLESISPGEGQRDPGEEEPQIGGGPYSLGCLALGLSIGLSPGTFIVM